MSDSKRHHKKIKQRRVSGEGSGEDNVSGLAKVKDFNIRIARDGRWFYRGTPIARHEMVKLFSMVLKRDEDGAYWLETPVEKGRIEVEDAPFVAVELRTEGSGRDRKIDFRTNVDEWVHTSSAHPVRVDEAENGEPSPYIWVRDGLEALILRPVFYHLVELAEPNPGNADELGIWSRDRFFPLGSKSGMGQDN